jgi:uncharacterized protein YdaU (DUF1376 family)
VPDLTRFDFHVVRFMNSYDVEVMTAEEIGQYLLLLCKSWLLQKEAGLPNDPAYLAKIARVEKVSERVLAKFPVVETAWGPMRRNNTLYEEWVAAEQRSDKALERVAARGGKWAETANKKIQEKYCGNTPLIPIPYHTVPYQPVPTQSCDWDLFRKRHSHVLGKKANSAKFQEKYEAACVKYGEDVVFTCFDEWADAARDWIKRDRVDHPLFAFFKILDSLAEDEIANRHDKEEIKQEKTLELNKIQESKRQIEKNLEAQMKADAEFMEKAPRENGASALDYISNLT